MRGVLEGLESSWDSPGLGMRQGSFVDGPTVGQPFKFFPDQDLPGTTTAVQSVRQLGKGPGYEYYGFRTLNSTYTLLVWIDEKEKEGPWSTSPRN